MSSSITSTGTGRAIPSRMRENAIPTEARLLAVADAFDAMTSPRPYRSAHAGARAARACSCAARSSTRELAHLSVDVWSWQADAVAS